MIMSDTNNNSAAGTAAGTAAKPRTRSTTPRRRRNYAEETRELQLRIKVAVALLDGISSDEPTPLNAILNQMRNLLVLV
jgi:hypothetical protein